MQAWTLRSSRGVAFARTVAICSIGHLGASASRCFLISGCAGPRSFSRALRRYDGGSVNFLPQQAHHPGAKDGTGFVAFLLQGGKYVGRGLAPTGLGEFDCPVDGRFLRAGGGHVALGVMSLPGADPPSHLTPQCGSQFRRHGWSAVRGSFGHGVARRAVDGVPRLPLSLRLGEYSGAPRARPQSPLDMRAGNAIASRAVLRGADVRRRRTGDGAQNGAR
jgi:hypothetical protein